jgi:hypothetical protein
MNIARAGEKFRRLPDFGPSNLYRPWLNIERQRLDFRSRRLFPTTFNDLKKQKKIIVKVHGMYVAELNRKLKFTPKNPPRDVIEGAEPYPRLATSCPGIPQSPSK